MTSELLESGREVGGGPDPELSVLGAVMLTQEALDVALPLLEGRDFERPAHEIIWNAVAAVAAKGRKVDAVTVMDQLKSDGDLAAVGGAAHLHTCVHECPTASNADQYARIVSERATLRRLAAAGMRIVQLSRGAEPGDADDVVAASHRELSAVTDERAADEWVAVGDLLDETLDGIEEAGKDVDVLTGVPTGFIDLDRLTNGLHPGQMVVIAARPAQGKSTLGLDLCRAASIHHQMASVMFSLEMSRAEITMRLLSAEAQVPLQNMRSGKMSEDDWARVARARTSVDDAPFFIDDSPNLTLAAIMSKARRLKRLHDLRLIVVDYLQLMTSGWRVESRQQEVSEFSRALKLLAKELQVPVVALSQLNRGPEQRTDKKPAMSDLRESGSIEQDCDVCVLLFRPDAYEKESPRAGEADFMVAKHRNGRTDTITVAFQGHYSRFVDMAPDWQPEPS